MGDGVMAPERATNKWERLTHLTEGQTTQLRRERMSRPSTRIDGCRALGGQQQEVLTKVSLFPINLSRKRQTLGYNFV